MEACQAEKCEKIFDGLKKRDEEFLGRIGSLEVEQKGISVQLDNLTASMEEMKTAQAKTQEQVESLRETMNTGFTEIKVALARMDAFHEAEEIDITPKEDLRALRLKERGKLRRERLRVVGIAMGAGGGFSLLITWFLNNFPHKG